MISVYESNAKNVIKHELFLNPRYYNKEITTIKYYKYARSKFSKITEAIKSKEDRNEIRDTILGLIK